MNLLNGKMIGKISYREHRATEKSSPLNLCDFQLRQSAPSRRRAAYSVRENLLKQHLICNSCAFLWLILIFLSSSTLSAIAETTREEKRAFEFGQKAMEDHLYELAERRFQIILTQFPKSEFSEEAAALSARACLSQGRWQETVELLEARVPTCSAAWQDAYYFLIGEAYLKGESSEAAYKSYENLISHFPKSKHFLEAKYGMARALLQQRKFDAGQEILRLIEKEGPGNLKSQATLSLGISMFLQKKYDQAADLFTRLVKEEANQTIGFQALYSLGELEIERKQSETARIRFDAIVKSDRQEAANVVPPALFRLGQMEITGKNWPVAIDYFEKAFHKSDDTSFQVKCIDSLVQAYLNLKKVDLLADKLQSWSESAENDKTRLAEALLLEVGILWQQAREGDKAIHAFLDFLEKYPNGQLSDSAHFRLGWVYFEDKKYETAADQFQKAVKLAKTPQLKFDALLKLGDLYFESASLKTEDSAASQFELAASNYTQASEIKGIESSQTEQALYQAANAYFRSGELLEVFKLHDAHNAQFKNGKLAPEFLLLVAAANRKGEEVLKVIDTYKTFLEKYSTSNLAPQAWIDYIEVLLMLNQCKEAIEAVDSFIAAFPKHHFVPRALLDRGRSFERLEQTENAIVEFEALIKNYSKTDSAAEAQFWLGTYYFNQKKDYAKAQTQFELLRKNSTSVELVPAATYFAALSAYHLDQKKENISRLIIKELVKDYPNSPWVFDGMFLYADILTEEGNFSAALQIFDDLVKKAETIKSVQLTEKMPEVQGRRGQCLRQLKRFEEAVQAFKIVLDLPQADISSQNQAYVELGKTFENMEDTEQALKNYLEPLYQLNLENNQPATREFFWICKGGLAAVRLLENQRKWSGASGVLKRIIQAKLPCADNSKEHLQKLQKEHANIE